MNDVKELLRYIDPTYLNYTEWVNVGMALKEGGYTVRDWDEWSSKDVSRYHAGDCEKKWHSFNGNVNPVTVGTIYQMAVDRGYQPNIGHELDWNSPIDSDGPVIDAKWLEGIELQEPTDTEWTDKRCKQELVTYLETLFESGETVGLVVKSYKNDKGKYVPKDKGLYSKTAGQLIEDINKQKCIQDVIGDYDPDGGAWIRFNPLDGKGVRNDNVTEYRYALVESDTMELEQQNAMLREMALPIAVLMYSGGKSLHAIVKIDAVDYAEYKKRVDYLYGFCEKNGMIIDSQNRNPSRLSRLPGVTRGEHKQFIIAVNIGKSSWEEWEEWADGINDNLPDIEKLSTEWDDLPPLAPELIKGVLRQGHKMLIAGPSKAGKSFALIELCVAIAEGGYWLNWQCTQGSVLYVNLELDRASCLHRFRDVYKTLGIRPAGIGNIDIWNLRGRSVPMDKLSGKLIRRAKERNYMAVIIDPIYKVLTGDENSAEQMSKFCNEFDKICTELQCAVIYCHHHSKGGQGGKKAIDRSSGSGVFARDPDAVLDYIELEPTKEVMAQQENKAICRTCQLFMDAHMAWGSNELDPDSKLNGKTFLNYCQNALNDEMGKELQAQVDEAVKSAKSMTAWRIEGTLREFANFEPVNCWFKYPAHYIDVSESLKNLLPDDSTTPRGQIRKLNEQRKKKAEQEKIDALFEFDIAFESSEKNGRASLEEMANEMGKDVQTIGRWFGESKQKARANFKAKYKIVNDENGQKYVTRKE